MRRVSKPPTGIAATFVIHQIHGFMGSNGQKEQKELSYHQVQQMIKEQIDRIEHETGAQPEESTLRHNQPKCNLIAIIKSLWRMRRRCLRKSCRKSDRND